MQDIVDQLRKELPATFAGPQMDKLTGGALCWRTIQNRRSRREIPEECFFRSGTSGPTLVRRDRFLDWWQSTLVDSRQPRPSTPPRRNRSTAETESTAA